MEQVKRWQYWVELVLGLVLMESPWILGGSSTLAVPWSSLVGGAAISIVAACSICPPERGPVDWANVPVGVGVAAAPILFGFWGMTDVARFDIVVGLAVAALAAWGGLATRRSVDGRVNGRL